MIKLSIVIKYLLITLSIILLCLLGLLVVINYLKDKEDFSAGKYYSEDDDEYVEPKVIENLINEKEIQYIIDQSKDKFETSTVVAGPGLSVMKKARDSKTAWLSKEDPIIKEIMMRVCKMTNKTHEQCEDLQVVKYDANGFYREHHDSCCDDNDLCDKFKEESGQRLRTCVIYLTDGFEGGATKFPNLNIELKPSKGSGVLFHPMTKDETKCHPKALHAGMPVISGIKIIANVWIREKEFKTKTI